VWFASAIAAPAEKTFLVCPPDHFDTHFLFNPFMDYRERVNPRRARSQWRRLVKTLEQAGAAIETMAATPASSALPFTADGALCFAPGRALVLRNDGPRGELEPPLFASWLRANGYETESLPLGCTLDGGNVLRLPGGDLLLGVKPRGAGRAERYLAKLIGLVAGARTTEIPLRHQRHMHLDTAVGVVDERTYLVYPDALEPAGDAGWMPADPIEVGAADAQAFACNLVVVGDVVITGMISRGLVDRIAERGYNVERLDLGEFHKAGGGAKCLTLPLWPAEAEGSEHGGEDGEPGS
jgi:N-dimethylarginine dimethylaminohydrolase